MLRQIVISLAVFGAAFFGWLYLVPDAPATLARYGVSLPFGPTAEAAQPPAAETGAHAGAWPGANRPTNVVTQKVTLATINDSLTAIGEGVAIHSVTVTSPSGGTLNALSVKPGDIVTAGALIGQLDDDEQKIALDKARLSARDTQASLQRSTELAKSNAVSTVTLNTAQLAADTADLEVRNAELNLQRRSILAPVGGTVGLMQVTPGNYVGANTAVTTIDDTSEILVTFWVPERYAPQLGVGMPVEASAVALPGQVFTGEISAVDNRIDSTSRTLQVQATIPNEARNMRAGMSFSVTMRFPGETFPAVNPLAIQWSADGSYVWTIADGKAQKVMTKIVQRNGDGVLVDGPLDKDQPVITEGVLQLQEGMQVAVLGAPHGTEGSPEAPGTPEQL